MSRDKAFFYTLPNGTLFTPKHAGNVGHGIDGVRSVDHAATHGQGVTHALSLLATFCCC